MSTKIILILTMFISLQIFNSIQAEIIRGMDIPKVNITKIVGKWYFLTSLGYVDDKLACTSNVIEQLSDDSFTMNTTYTFTPDVIKEIPALSDGSVHSAVGSPVQKDSNIILLRTRHGEERVIVIFDTDYDSYMAICMAYTMEYLSSGTRGFVFILSRQKTLPNSIIDKVEQSELYQQVMKPGLKLVTLNTTYCE